MSRKRRYKPMKDAVTYLRENWDKWNEQLEKDYYYERSDSYRAKEDFYREPEIIESTLLRLSGKGGIDENK